MEMEKDNIDVMEALLKAKAEQCPQFYDCLMENKEKVLAEAGPSRFWASGISPFITENCAPTYWPGQNMLGALLKELTHALLTKEQQSVESSDQLGDQDGNSVKQDSDIDESEDEESERTVTEKELNDKTDNQNRTDNQMEVVSQDVVPGQNHVDPSLPAHSSALDPSKHGHGSPIQPVSSLPTSNVSTSVHSSPTRSGTNKTGTNKTKAGEPKKSKKKKQVNKSLTSTPRQIDIQKAFPLKRLADASPEDQNELKSQWQGDS